MRDTQEQEWGSNGTLVNFINVSYLHNLKCIWLIENLPQMIKMKKLFTVSLHVIL